MNPRTVFTEQFLFFGEYCTKLKANGPAIENVVAADRDDHLPVVCSSSKNARLLAD